MSTKLAAELSLSPGKTTRNIRVANESSTVTRWTVNSVSVQVSFSNQTTENDFLVIDDIPASMISGTPTLEKLEAMLNLFHNYFTRKIGNDEVQLLFEHEISGDKTSALPLHTHSENFTSDSNLEGTDASSAEDEHEKDFLWWR